MITESIIFSEGISNVIEPYLIPNGSCQYSANAKISSGALESAKQPVEDVSLVYGGDHAIYYKAQDEVVASAEDRFYVEWAGYLYWSNAAGTLKRYDGTTINNIGGHTAPTVAPGLTVPAAGLLNGSYLYVITYLHDDTFESAPCSAVSITATNQSVLVTFGDTPPASATHRLIYRSGGYNPTFNLVAKVPIATATYTDNTSDFNISRKELTTTTNEAPPTNLDMLVEKSGTFFGALGNKVYFSKQGQPEYWSSYQYVETATDVTGLGVVGDSIIAFTDDSMYIILGNDIRTISIRKLPFKYGCKHKRTVKSVEGRLVWLSAMDEYDILCSYNGNSVEKLNVTNNQITTISIGTLQYDSFDTETFSSFYFNVLNSIVAGRKYYLFLTNRTVVVDFEFGVKTYYMKETVEGAYEKNNQLYIISTGKIYEYLKSNPPYRDFSYTSKEYSNGELTRKKTYRKINVHAKGKWTIAIMINNQIVHTLDYTNGDNQHLPAGLHGNTISFIITSTGYTKVKGISYEYERGHL